VNRHRLAGRRPALVAAALGAAVLLAACGSSSSSSSSGGGGVASIGNAASTSAAAATQPQTAAQREAALEKAAQCMRSHGVKSYPDPTVDSNGNVQQGSFSGIDRNDPSVRSAFQACRSLFAASRPQFSQQQQQALQDAILAYAKCMRTNGYDMPDPTFDGGGAGGPGGGGIFGNRNANRNDPTFKKANTACRPTLQKALASAGLGGGFGRGPGGGGGGGGGGNGGGAG
jgi:hypothetical protein